MYHQLNVDYGKEKSDNFTSYILNLILIFVFLISLFMFFFPSLFITIFAAGLDKPTNLLASGFLKITSITLLMNLFFNMFKNYLQANNKVYYQVAATVPMNLIVVLGIIYSYKNNDIYYMVYAFVIGSFSQLVVFYPAIKSLNYRYIQTISINKDIKAFFVLSIPIIFQSLFMQLNSIVDKNVASFIVAGGVSALSYAKQIENVVYSLFISVILMISFPRMSKFFASGNFANFHSLASNSFLITLLLVLPASFGLFFFSEYVVQIIYGRGNFGQSSIIKTAYILKYAAIGISFLATNQLLVKLFYIQKNTKTPLYIYGFTLTLNIVLNLFFYKYTGIGLAGISLATSISYIINTFILFYVYNNRYGLFFKKSDWQFLLKIFLACIFMIFLTNSFVLQFSYLSNNPLLIFLTAFLVYSVTLLISSVNEIRSVMNNFRF